ncbi:helix-turn-helix transcriptional regulator [Kitasatospora sp. NPDC054939]
MKQSAAPRTSWTFLTSHARVLLLISRDPSVRLRDLAQSCELTERAVQAIVTDLEAAGYLSRSRDGRRNHYRVLDGTTFRHPAEAGHEIAGLLRLLGGAPADEPAPDGPDGAAAEN